MFDIRKKLLTKEEAKLLVREIKKTPNISGYSIWEWIDCQNVFIAVDHEGQILGASLNDDFGADWTEIAVLFVLEKHRENGICRALYNISCEDIINRKRNVLIMSREPIVSEMIRKSNLDVLPTLNNLPESYRQHQLKLTLYYKFRYFMNLYRNFEILRKRLTYGKNTSLIYGLKLA